MVDTKVAVFLADDHNVVRQALAELIARDGRFDVIGQCGQALKVVEQVRQLKPDVLVLDISMPGLNGLDICREVTRKARQVKVLILSMLGDEEIVVKALESGAAGYILKDADNDELLEAIAAVARGERYLGPGISAAVFHRLGRGGEDPYDRLSLRERQVLQLICEGRTTRKAAEVLGLAAKTVDTHRTRLMHKLGIHDQKALVKYALRKGIVTLR